MSTLRVNVLALSVALLVAGPAIAVHGKLYVTPQAAFSSGTAIGQGLDVTVRNHMYTPLNTALSPFFTVNKVTFAVAEGAQTLHFRTDLTSVASAGWVLSSADASGNGIVDQVIVCRASCASPDRFSGLTPGGAPLDLHLAFDVVGSPSAGSYLPIAVTGTEATGAGTGGGADNTNNIIYIAIQ